MKLLSRAPGRAKRRLDVLLVERGLVPSREKAQALILLGDVSVDGVPAPKPGVAIRGEPAVTLRARPQHVGRGAGKLLGALDALGVEPRGRVAIDVGASTGGFTEVLLQRGAARVYAVDVGRAQLHERLRRDPRVVVKERVNARRLAPELIGEPCELAVMDVSFISALKILPALRGVLSADAEVLVLVKPQFEVGREQVGRGGLVKDPRLRQQALARVALSCREMGYAVIAACASDVAGAAGNRELFLHLRARGTGLAPDEIEAMATRAVEG
jgi:23S rRNA (cytidine1920-2'-O)/16S rRNA (cytidine1409-2'-O)-methyltransferase